MRVQVCLVFLVLFLIEATFAQEIPAQNPAEVWVKGRQVQHSWRDGRIYVDTLVLEPLLGIGSEFRQMDLLETLEKKGGYIWTITDGKFEAKRDRSLYAEFDPAQIGASNQRSAATANASLQKKQAEKMEPYLVYHVKRFTADTGYVRAYITIGNEGGSPSASSKVICQFQDGFGKTYAEYETVVPPLQPGALHQIEAFSMVEVEDTSITPTADNVAVNFFSDGKGPRSISEARQEARARKRSRL
jgi:hypothetical protein